MILDLQSHVSQTLIRGLKRLISLERDEVRRLSRSRDHMILVRDALMDSLDDPYPRIRLLTVNAIMRLYSSLEPNDQLVDCVAELLDDISQPVVMAALDVLTMLKHRAVKHVPRVIGNLDEWTPPLVGRACAFIAEVCIHSPEICDHNPDVLDMCVMNRVDALRHVFEENNT